MLAAGAARRCGDKGGNMVFDANAHIERVRRDGYTIVENAIASDLIDALNAALERLERERDVRPAMNPFEGHHTVRIYNL